MRYTFPTLMEEMFKSYELLLPPPLRLPAHYSTRPEGNYCCTIVVWRWCRVVAKRKRTPGRQCLVVHIKCVQPWDVNETSDAFSFRTL